MWVYTKHCLKQFTALRAISIRSQWIWELYNHEMWNYFQDAKTFGNFAVQLQILAQTLSFLITILSPQRVKYPPCNFVWVYRPNIFHFLKAWCWPVSTRSPRCCCSRSMQKGFIFKQILMQFLDSGFLFLKQRTLSYWYMPTILKFYSQKEFSSCDVGSP